MSREEVVFIKGDHGVVEFIGSLRYALAIFEMQLQCGLCKKVVFKRWPLNKNFILGYIYMTI